MSPTSPTTAPAPVRNRNGRRRIAAALATLAAGAALVLPASGSASAAPATSAANSTYTVVAGDTLTRIAARFHTTVAALMAANHLGNANVIAVGQRLVVPGTTTQPAPPTKGIVTTSYGARFNPSVCKVANAYWHGHRRFYLNTARDAGCFTSPWFAGTHPVMVSFGPTVAPWYDDHRHHGIDIDMAAGTPIYSGVAGVVHVKPATLGTAYGVNAMLVRSGGYDYALGHMSRLAVRDGQTVKVGQLLGYSGMSGAETEDGPHLHFQVEPAGTSYLRAIDPHAQLRLTAH